LTADGYAQETITVLVVESGDFEIPYRRLIFGSRTTNGVCAALNGNFNIDVAKLRDFILSP